MDDASQTPPDWNEFRNSESEKLRSNELLQHVPTKGRKALDVGARDGYFSYLMADRFEQIVALDLIEPKVSHPKIQCVQANAANMPYADASFDFILCAEVLEHIPSTVLGSVCSEIQRVSGEDILIGVPYKQDIRVDRTTCYSCGKTNPPYGHVNSFDEARIAELFSQCEVKSVSYIGENRSRTNWLSAALLDFAGNPYGPYDQTESCIHCDQQLISPPPRSLIQKVATKAAYTIRKVTESLSKPHGAWVHILLRKSA